MTNTTTDPQATSAAFRAADDPRAVLATAVAIGASVIDGVRPDQLAASTPCEEFDVRALLGHLVGVLRRVAAIGRSESPFSVPDVVTGIAPDGWSAAWREAGDQVRSAWSDDVSLERIVVLPWAEMSGGPTLAMYTSEITTHTWDLATATGQQPAWDDTVLEVALAAIQQALPAEGRMAAFEAVFAQMPPELRDDGYPFAEAVPVPADAPLIDQLVGWNGRRP